jgi:hypothetical protein
MTEILIAARAALILWVNLAVNPPNSCLISLRRS